MTILKAAVLPVVAGLCLAASFAPLRLWLLAFLGVALLVYSLRGAGWLASFARGLLAGVALYLPLVLWSAVSTGTWVAPVALAVVLAIYIAVMCLGWQAILRRWTKPWVLAPALAVTWTAMEQVQGSWPYGGMTWGHLGFGQVEGTLIHLAPIGSTQIVAFVVVVGGVLLESLLHTPDVLVRVARLAALVAMIVVPIFVPIGGAPDSTITVAFVQGEVSRDPDLTGSERALAVTRNLAAETKNVVGKGADFALWPESASDLDPGTDREAHTIIMGALEELGVPLLLGTQSYFDDHRYNYYTLWIPGEGLTERYAKQHPVPFGEYIPARDFFRTFTSAVDQVWLDMRAGDKPAILDVPVGEGQVRIAVPICFEVAYTRIVTDAMREGAQFLVVPTNNASFGDTAESQQQFDMTRFRAVETRRSAIQISTVGVSGVVEPNGVVRDTTKMWTSEAHVVRIGLHDDLTPTVRYMEAITAVVYLLALLVLALSLTPKVLRGFDARRATGTTRQSPRKKRTQ